MIELTLTHRELQELLSLVEEHNPPDSTMLMAGRAFITVDTSSGIGSILKASVPVKVGDRWGDFTIRITDERHW